jgi:CheY-like chemotaxis protein
MSRASSLLLVEDQVLIALGQAKQLESLGYSVVMAHSSAQALEQVKAHADGLDLILMDIDLGSGKDGTETAREILAEWDIPIVFLSSHTERDIVEKTESITSYGYVVKSTGLTV